MSRTTAWRKTISDAANCSQMQVLHSTVYILREIGPTGFILKEEGVRKKIKVLIGSLHSCSCSYFTREGDLCKHICWILLKKFRLSLNDPRSWQLGLLVSEVNDLIRSAAAVNQTSNALDDDNERRSQASDGRIPLVEGQMEVVPGREVKIDDACPICQDDLLLSHRPVTYCRFGCGNNVHIKCMKIYADHQLKTSANQSITCPLCRTDFGPMEDLLEDYRSVTYGEGRIERDNEHAGLICSVCFSCPIMGRVCRCVDCAGAVICFKCFKSLSTEHLQHTILYRKKSTDRWRQLIQDSGGTQQQDGCLTDLNPRQLSLAEYLKMLPVEGTADSAPNDLTEDSLRWLPVLTVKLGSSLLNRAQQCCVCLRGYEVGQEIRLLPCRHRYHKCCIDKWLLHHSPTCPIDQVFYSVESIQQYRVAALRRKKRALSMRDSESDKRSSGIRAADNTNIELTVIPLHFQSHLLHILTHKLKSKPLPNCSSYVNAEQSEVLGLFYCLSTVNDTNFQAITESQEPMLGLVFNSAPKGTVSNVEHMNVEKPVVSQPSNKVCAVKKREFNAVTKSQKPKSGSKFHSQSNCIISDGKQSGVNYIPQVCGKSMLTTPQNGLVDVNKQSGDAVEVHVESACCENFCNIISRDSDDIEYDEDSSSIFSGSRNSVPRYVTSIERSSCSVEEVSENIKVNSNNNGHRSYSPDNAVGIANAFERSSSPIENAIESPESISENSNMFEKRSDSNDVASRIADAALNEAVMYNLNVSLHGSIGESCVCSSVNQTLSRGIRTGGTTAVRYGDSAPRLLHRQRLSVEFNNPSLIENGKKLTGDRIDSNYELDRNQIVDSSALNRSLIESSKLNRSRIKKISEPNRNKIESKFAFNINQMRNDSELTANRTVNDRPAGTVVKNAQVQNGTVVRFNKIKAEMNLRGGGPSEAKPAGILRRPKHGRSFKSNLPNQVKNMAAGITDSTSGNGAENPVGFQSMIHIVSVSRSNVAPKFRGTTYIQEAGDCLLPESDASSKLLPVDYNHILRQKSNLRKAVNRISLAENHEDISLTENQQHSIQSILSTNSQPYKTSAELKKQHSRDIISAESQQHSLHGISSTDSLKVSLYSALNIGSSSIECHHFQSSDLTDPQRTLTENETATLAATANIDATTDHATFFVLVL